MCSSKRIPLKKYIFSCLRLQTYECKPLKRDIFSKCNTSLYICKITPKEIKKTHQMIDKRPSSSYNWLKKYQTTVWTVWTKSSCSISSKWKCYLSTSEPVYHKESLMNNLWICWEKPSTNVPYIETLWAKYSCSNRQRKKCYPSTLESVFLA